jgi:hypothetical protein
MNWLKLLPMVLLAWSANVYAENCSSADHQKLQNLSILSSQNRWEEFDTPFSEISQTCQQDRGTLYTIANLYLKACDVDINSFRQHLEDLPWENVLGILLNSSAVMKTPVYYPRCLSAADKIRETGLDTQDRTELENETYVLATEIALAFEMHFLADHNNDGRPDPEFDACKIENPWITHLGLTFADLYRTFTYLGKSGRFPNYFAVSYAAICDMGDTIGYFGLCMVQKPEDVTLQLRQLIRGAISETNLGFGLKTCPYDVSQCICGT